MKLCPRCDATSKVYGVDKDDSVIIRYRQCKNPQCGYKFKTKQSPEEACTEDAFQHAEPMSSQ